VAARAEAQMIRRASTSRACVATMRASVVMELFDVQTISKLEAAIQQVEAAIDLFYKRQYAAAITLAAAAEGCLQWPPPSRCR
jgi:hypothetical protein